MKKKLVIIGLILITILFLLFINARGNDTTETINQEWLLNDRNINHINIIGSEQNINIKVIISDFEENSVRLKGKVSRKALKFLENSNVHNNSLEVQLSDYSAPRFMITTEAKDDLEVEIRLTRNKNLKKLKVESVIGNVVLDFPQTFVKKLDLIPQNGGEVIAHSKLKKNGQTKVKISTIGNIEY